MPLRFIATVAVAAFISYYKSEIARQICRLNQNLFLRRTRRTRPRPSAVHLVSNRASANRQQRPPLPTHNQTERDQLRRYAQHLGVSRVVAARRLADQAARLAASPPVRRPAGARAATVQYARLGEIPCPRCPLCPTCRLPRKSKPPSNGSARNSQPSQLELDQKSLLRNRAKSAHLAEERRRLCEKLRRK